MISLSYKQSMSAERPLDIEIGLTTAYFRKNVKQEFIDFGDHTDLMWLYQEATVPKEDFNSVMNQFLLECQQAAASDQMTIMEAIADLYETIAALM